MNTKQKTLKANLEEAKEYAARINKIGKDKIRAYKGTSNEVIIRTLIEAGYSKEEAEKMMKGTI